MKFVEQQIAAQEVRVRDIATPSGRATVEVFNGNRCPSWRRYGTGFSRTYVTAVGPADAPDGVPHITFDVEEGWSGSSRRVTTSVYGDAARAIYEALHAAFGDKG